jgi:hypothetical protein
MCSRIDATPGIWKMDPAMKRATFVAGMFFVMVLARAADAAGVTPLKTPDGGIQPQAVMDGKGVLHLIYFKGEAAAGDLFYVRREAGQEKFSAPLRVNSQPSSAVAVGTIRGAQLALGKDGRVHVAWNGSGKAMPQAFNKTPPMLYARLNDAGKAFEPQRNLLTQTFNLDGGGALAADETGNVYVAWHANQVGKVNSEAARQVWLARSTDGGKTFGKEALAFNDPTGVCACCGMKGFVDSQGAIHILFRSATDQTNRDMYLLSSKDAGKTFQGTLLQKWNVNSCTMSSAAFTEGPTGTFAAWETQKQVYFAKLMTDATQPGKPVAAPGTGTGDRKHPALATNAAGETILVWTEGTGWQKGGALAWCVFDKDGKPTAQTGRVNGGIPVWGLPTVVAGKDGGFLIVH